MDLFCKMQDIQETDDIFKKCISMAQGWNSPRSVTVQLVILLKQRQQSGTQSDDDICMWESLEAVF